ncbi:ABC transporter permease [uncultured Cedecea sp.]|uniref:ABC transporter permease n=1 Tax=uncultured Cedecea sp. TaxID=988762 RepID=UPI00261E7989|nr:ABC transporter permease [uncultured Cedecea sp.]
MTPSVSHFSWRRLKALCCKESKQIIRDPSCALIAVLIPLMLLFIFGYGINLDAHELRLGILIEEQSQPARELVNIFAGSPFIDTVISDNRKALIDRMQSGDIRGIIVIPVNFATEILQAEGHAAIQIITDGSEPNTANFVQAYASGVWKIWQQQQGENLANAVSPLIELNIRYWFNEAAISQNFIIPGAISIIITVVGAILTSLVVAREWERGTMEALLATQITRTELLLSKLLPYQILGSFVMVLCMVVTTVVFNIPYRGSLLILFVITSLYLTTVLGMGLLISTITRNQFNAAMIALNAAFLPAIMLSGFIFEIASMPAVIQWVTYFIPARYFVSSLQSLFLAGDIFWVLLTDILLLIASAILFIGLTALKTRRHLD